MERKEKTNEILKCLMENPRMTLTDISKRTGIALTTVFDILKTDIEPRDLLANHILKQVYQNKKLHKRIERGMAIIIREFTDDAINSMERELRKG